jgi:hypothetical protein
MWVCVTILFSLQLKIIYFQLFYHYFIYFCLIKRAITSCSIRVKYELNIYVCLPNISNMNTKGICFMSLHNLCKKIVDFKKNYL